MITALLIAALSWVAVRSNIDRFVPLAIFLIPALMFQALAGSYGLGGLHYAMGAYLDYLVVLSLSSLAIKNKITVILSAASVVSIALNGIGFIMYEAYMEPYLYNFMYILLYSIILAASIGERNGLPSAYWRGLVFYGSTKWRY